MKNFLINLVCFVMFLLNTILKIVNLALSVALVFMTFSKLKKRG